MSHAYLILCHDAPRHVITLAMRHPKNHYYIHLDGKSPSKPLDILRGYKNIHILNNRIAVNWGGFSMILATLNLFQAALSQPENRYFHLMSGHCVPLVSPDFLTEQFQKWGDNTLFLQCKNTPNLRYRTRFNAPHADTLWQRHLIGKALTKLMKWADKLLPSSQNCFSGSQWFSADRMALQTLFGESLGDVAAYFEKKLVPDEHFFQYIVQNLPEKFNLINDNHRFVRFQNHANHPDFLSLDELWAAQREGAWFARKVSPENMARFLEYEPDL
ncbi:beta-1,6-N-acetylglucosaminyltransferase [Alysiella filiformis]|uniref:Peptide O-xylosyltransferase n=1 Tax=Alysiella filiformis DSM 16848 TaxID=1120981 RepID=A0A286E3Y9_9NEIS|nr:beta-1,6-N-acetylglucosaminyltransferase [Alysiella filiformis]QMT31037.1 glycogen branching protein [Alysiella filiformis]UBQ55973.1 beta-1,6-N-acetylglucosaminyltransferase [Alysiella filiformis DSM 16848]SOD65616.1 Core-2/I-Branching enzyme [Alysiella filiformis DSM 16848]